MNFDHFPGFPGKANFNQFYWLYFGLYLAPRLFPEFNKPLTPFLSLLGHEPAEYIHEIWLVGITVKEVSDNISDTTEITTNLDFVINKAKVSSQP